MIVHFPMSTKVLTEARLYATDSILHTMDYDGWQDQHQKHERITYGNFGQLWVAEFCRLNGIAYHKDASSPERPDDYDLIVHGYKIDVKTSVIADFVGQVSPGVFNKPIDYFCFLLTDRLCSYIAPWGFIEAEKYREIAICVEQGEIIPGSTVRQRFSRSYFLPPEPELIPFVQFMKREGKARSRVVQPSTIVDGRSIDELTHQLETNNRLTLELIRNSAPRRKTGKVTQMAGSGDLFGKSDEVA